MSELILNENSINKQLYSAAIDIIYVVTGIQYTKGIEREQKINDAIILSNEWMNNFIEAYLSDLSNTEVK